ncbi:major facilitator superfamily MFS_1 (plasmid) [Haloterrigena turkmenica DSM 5511]|uniref:Major facilitator superfamily MFS_1 n=1 Tax=Haloterrigena turkmenica (strain ATCC 51198 / DSM 5511 / JCM 9101 / NCIMB 13204 / VKM B-1734 / 4k) TaxID=543526 RepID=D2S082_HALTV|nr:MFS transporter [Haloterrigena turkmenica]ADB62779.1 major facilitator superfamily MFS_1 [Haloterrigena turkmenica DSM 5511]
MPARRVRGDVPWSSALFQTVLACSLIGVMGVPLISPILPSLRSVFGISDAQIGLVITAYTLPGVFLTPFIGLISDRLGRRAVVLPLLTLFGLAGGGIALGPPFRGVLALRFVQGIGGSGLMVLAITLIGDFYAGERRNTVMGINGSAIGIGAAAYPLLGGVLAAVRWNVPFAFFGLSLVVGAIALFTLEEPAVDDPPAIGPYVSRVISVVLVPRALGLWAAAFLTFFLFYGCILTVLSLLLSDVYGLSSGQIGLLFGAVSIANASIASQYGRVSRYFEAEELIALGFVGFGISLLGVWAASTPVLIGVMLLCFGLGFGLVMPSLDTTVVGLVSGQLRASMMGVLTSMLWLGQTVGPIAFTGFAGVAFDEPVTGYRFLLLFWGVATLVSGGLAFLALDRRS